MSCFFYTGPRGSGKSLGAVHQIYTYLKSGRPVATNLDIEAEPLISLGYNLTRLPDKPAFEHCRALGYAYTDGPIPKHEYDEGKNGLIVLDEISLFLASKRDPEFSPLMDWLVQSRKFGWDLILIAQSKDQVNETVYKSLCDNLVLCKADKLVPIPYVSKLLQSFGLSGRLPDNHTALVLNGRSEQNNVIETISYSRKKLQSFYNTAQTFNDGNEYINGSLIDFRASYSVVPGYILTGQKLIDGYNSDIAKVQLKLKQSENKVGDSDVVNHHKNTASFIKIGLLLIAAVVFFFFNNPFDNELLKAEETAIALVAVPSAVPAPVASSAVPVSYDADPFAGVFEKMIQGAELTIPFHSDNDGFKAIIQITTQTSKSFISLADLRVLGWYALKTDNVVFLKNGKKTISIPMSLQVFKKEKF